MSFSPLADILNKNLKNKGGLSEQIIAALVCEEFDKLIKTQWGEKITTQVRALYLKDNILTIACLSSVAAQEIRLSETSLINKINSRFQGAVSRLRYLV